MKIKEKAKPAIPPVAPGVYFAICIGVIDLGEQYHETFKKYSNDVQIVWELSGEFVEIDGEQKPRQLSRTFSISRSKNSSLRKFLSSWNSKQYTDTEFGDLELFDQLQKACQLQIVLNDSGEYSNVDNIMPLPKGVPVPATDTPLMRWDMDDWNDTVFQTLPEWVQEKIKKSTQYKTEHLPQNKLEIPTPTEFNTSTPEECPI